MWFNSEQVVASSQNRTYTKVPDGVYLVTIVEAKYASDDYREQIKVTFLNGKSKHFADLLLRHKTLEPEKQQNLQAMTVSFMWSVGFDAKGKSQQDWIDYLENLPGQELWIELKTKNVGGKDYQNAIRFWNTKKENMLGIKMPKVPEQKDDPWVF